MEKIREVLEKRKTHTQKILSKTSYDAWLVISRGNDANLEYLIGSHPGNTTLGLLTPEKLKVIVSSLEDSLINPHVDEIKTYYGSSELMKLLHSTMDELKGKTVLINNASPFQTSHAANILAKHEKMLKNIGDLYGVNFVSSNTFVESIRTVKTKPEQELIKTSVNKTLEIIEKIFANMDLTKTEKEIAAEFYKEFYTFGQPAFDPIVTFGQATKYPHYIPQDKTLEGENILYVDVGLKYHSVCADITRTFFVSEPNEKQTKAYKTLVKAQEKAIDTIKAGVPARKPDIKAREVIEKNGFDPQKFSHGLGHALGAEVHDVGPSLYKKTDKSVKLKKGQIYTIEPGLYFKKWGIRLEDNIIVKEDSATRLSKAPQQPPLLHL